MPRPIQAPLFDFFRIMSEVKKVKVKVLQAFSVGVRGKNGLIHTSFAPDDVVEVSALEGFNFINRGLACATDEAPKIAVAKIAVAKKATK
jgi:hypothetical protein